VNTGAPQPTPFPLMEEAEARVLGIQTKLHHWAAREHGRRFDDLFNLVCDRNVVALRARALALSGLAVATGDRARATEAVEALPAPIPLPASQVSSQTPIACSMRSPLTTGPGSSATSALGRICDGTT
jgi:RNA-directed DNA polymerase